MKYLFNMTFRIAAALAALVMVACGKETTQPEYLDVNASNLNGNWQLTTIDGAPINEGTYFYINFKSSGREYTIWENITSIPGSPNIEAGTFSINTDTQEGAYIRGISEVLVDWEHLYLVRELTDASMTWIALDDAALVRKFVRVDEIPEDLKE